jgi:hypothetical protein
MKAAVGTLKLRTDGVGGVVVKVYDDGGAVMGWGKRRGGTAPFFPERPVYEWRSRKGAGVRLPGGLWVAEGGGEFVEFGRWHMERGGDAEVLLSKYQRRTELVIKKGGAGIMRGDPKKPQTFRLSGEATKVLEMLAWENRMNKTEALEKVLLGEIVVRNERVPELTLLEVVGEDEELLALWRGDRAAVERLWQVARGKR